MGPAFCQSCFSSSKPRSRKESFYIYDTYPTAAKRKQPYAFQTLREALLVPMYTDVTDCPLQEHRVECP